MWGMGNQEVMGGIELSLTILSDIMRPLTLLIVYIFMKISSCDQKMLPIQSLKIFCKLNFILAQLDLVKIFYSDILNWKMDFIGLIQI